MNFKLAFPCTCVLMIVFGCNRQVSKTEPSLPVDSREWILEEVLCSFKESEYYDDSRKYWLVNEAYTTPREGYFMKASFFTSGYADSLLLKNTIEPYGSKSIEIRDRCGIPGIDQSNQKLFTDAFYIKNDYITLTYPVELKHNQFVLLMDISLGLPDVVNEFRVLIEKKDGKVNILWDKFEDWN